MIFGVAYEVNVCSSIEAEAEAIREGMELAVKLKIRKIEVETDSASIINSVLKYAHDSCVFKLGWQ